MSDMGRNLLLLLVICVTTLTSCQDGCQHPILCSRETEYRKQFNGKNYTFDFIEELQLNPDKSAVFDAKTSSALFDTHISASIVPIPKCSLNLPHTHPRATEIAFVLKGELTVGFSEENGGGKFEQTIGKGQAMVFPQGTIHFQVNKGCEDAQMYSVFNHHDPGFLQIPLRLNVVSKTVLRAAYGLKQDALEQLLKVIPSSAPAPLIGEECNTKCFA